jgi:hypothetical protein
MPPILRGGIGAGDGLDGLSGHGSDVFVAVVEHHGQGGDGRRGTGADFTQRHTDRVPDGVYRVVERLDERRHGRTGGGPEAADV